MDHLNPAQIGASAIEAGYRAPWAPAQFEADGERVDWDGEPTEPGRLRAAMHLPRWASRATIPAVTEVRVERLNDISEADAIAEGVEPWDGRDNSAELSARDAYQILWESLHGPGSWALNPWVCVVAWKTVEHRNIDEVKP
jgi:hypothetical protein